MSAGTEVDVVVVGLGPGGESVATQLAQAGLEVVGVDHRLVGGECPYFGCVPSKMMVRAADALAEGRRVPGLAGQSTVTPDWAPVHERIRDEATADWDDAVAVERLEKAGVTLRARHRPAQPARAPSTSPVRRTPRAAGWCSTPAPSRAPRRCAGLADTPYWTNRDAVAARGAARARCW